VRLKVNGVELESQTLLRSCKLQNKDVIHMETSVSSARYAERSMRAEKRTYLSPRAACMEEGPVMSACANGYKVSLRQGVGSRCNVRNAGSHWGIMM
jgi:hypothetical protein